MEINYTFAREIWHGDSRDGALEDDSGFHYFKMNAQLIVEAYEYYQLDDGTEVVSPLPEMRNIDWIEDLGFEDFSTLEMIDEDHFSHIKTHLQKKK
jgi:hypothetical protein